MKFKNHYNSVPEDGEVNDQVSETIPDQSLSVQEILERFAKGLNLQGRTPIWMNEDDDDLSFDDWDKLDIAEREAIIERNKEEFLELGKKLKDDKRKKALEAQRKKEEEIEARIKERLNKKSGSGQAEA